MPGNEKDIKIISDIAKNINTEVNYPKHTTEDQSTQQENLDEESSSFYELKKQHIINKNKKKDSPLTPKQLLIKKGNQNLAERKVLLTILAILLGIQLFFMNGVVLLIVLYSVFDWDTFRDLDATTLHNILGFTKYYVTAVLVELLGGIIYIVHRVFSNDD